MGGVYYKEMYKGKRQSFLCILQATQNIANVPGRCLLC